MRFTPDNFFMCIKNLVTGTNAKKNGIYNSLGPSEGDGGIQHDVPLPLSAISNPADFPAITDSTTGTASTTFGAIAGTTYATDAPAIKNALAQIAKQLNSLNVLFGSTVDSSTVPVYVIPAGVTTGAGTISLPIPRDYDEASDSFQLRVFIALASGSVDTNITLTGTPTITPIATGTSTTGTTVNATLTYPPASDLTTGQALTTTEQVLQLKFEGLGLLRDSIMTVQLAIAGTTASAVDIYAIEVKYDSTIVSYNDTDQRGLDGSLSEYGNPLR